MRISASNLGATLPRLTIKPYRVEGRTAHFDVSRAEFDNFSGQIRDAIAFLQSSHADVALLLRTTDASGEMDFGIERSEAPFQFNAFPADLSRLAGELGLSLTLSTYPVSGASDAEA